MRSQGNYANFTCFPHESPNVHAVFWRCVLNLCTRVVWVPVDPPSKGVRVYVFPALNLGLHKARVSQKPQTTKDLAAKKRPPLVVTGWQGLIEHVRKFQELSPQSGVNFRILLNLVAHIEPDYSVMLLCCARVVQLLLRAMITADGLNCPACIAVRVRSFDVQAPVP